MGRHEGRPPDADRLGTVLERNGLDQQWQAVIDQARNETYPNWVWTMAGQDPRRAKVI